MREIKLRAYSGAIWARENRAGAMFDLPLDELVHIGIRKIVLGVELHSLTGKIIITSSTGVFDKTGREIYEGDVVMISEHPHIVEFSNGCFITRGLWGDWMGNIESEEMEVIGNIYENPELVK